MLTIALPKGRLAEESAELLLQKKWLSALPKENKQLFYTDPNNLIKILFVRSQDVPTYVEECAADLGIVGWDVLKEGGYDLVCPVTLDIGGCRLSLASKPEFELHKFSHNKIRVATKYPKLSKEFFFSKGLNCEIIKLYGSIELAPLCDLSDCIVDLVSTGETLRANGLVEKEVILNSTARVVLNRASLYTKRKECSQFIQDLSN